MKEPSRSYQLEQAEIILFSEFFNQIEADKYFEVLREKINWQQRQIKLFGKKYLEPRLTAFFAVNDMN